MKERPILFSAPMVRAILAGTKTQTRRVVKPQPTDDVEGSGRWYWFKGINSRSFDCHAWPENFIEHCPYGAVGDRLWVRESFYFDLLSYANGGPLPKEKPDKADENLYYAADGKCCQIIPECACAEVGKPRFRPSIYMPRWASRITLEIVSISVECLQDISEDDAKAEGILRARPVTGEPLTFYDYLSQIKDPCEWFSDPRRSFQSLWRSINGPDSWQSNPWVWVVEFKHINQPVQTP